MSLHSFFVNLFSQKRSLENPQVPIDSDAAYDILVESAASSGLHVSRQTVLGYPAVWRGAKLISSSIARLPCDIFRRQGNGGRAKDTNHPAYQLLRWSPSEYYSSYTFFETLMTHALLHGNGYAFVFRNSLGEPTELAILNPEITYPVRVNGRLWYATKIDDMGNVKRQSPANIIHIKGLGFDGLVGYSVIHMLRESLGLGLAYQRYGSVFFRNNAKPNMVIELPGSLRDPAAIQRLRSSIADVHTGIDKQHRPWVLENGAKVSAFPVSNEEAQWLQSREFDVIQVANILGLPPHKLGAKISSSYSSLEQENRAFLNDSLGGWLTNIELELRAKLLRENEKENDTHFVEFNRQALERADLLTEVNALVQQTNNGLLSKDEARALLNRPPLVDGFGKDITIPANLKTLGEEPPAPPAPSLMPQEQQPGDDEEVDDQPDEKQQEANRQLMQHTINRITTRVGKAAQRAAKDAGKFHHWLDADLVATNRTVAYDSLLPVVRVCDPTANSTADTDKLVDDLFADLRATLNEVSGQHSADTLAKGIRSALHTYQYTGW